MKTLDVLYQNQLTIIFNLLLARDIKASIIFNLLLAKAIILLYFFFFFLEIFNNFLTTPVVTVNIKVKDAPAIPTGIPTIVAYDPILKVPNDADNDHHQLKKHLMYLITY